jgi:hypothetical protein
MATSLILFTIVAVLTSDTTIRPTWGIPVIQSNVTFWRHWPEAKFWERARIALLCVHLLTCLIHFNDFAVYNELRVGAYALPRCRGAMEAQLYSRIYRPDTGAHRNLDCTSLDLLGDETRE